jgi:hypothetical protein
MVPTIKYIILKVDLNSGTSSSKNRYCTLSNKYYFLSFKKLDVD